MNNAQFIETKGNIADQPMEANAKPEDSAAVKAAKAAIAEAKRQLALAQGKEPTKGRKGLSFEPITIAGQVDKAKLQALQLAYPDKGPTELLRFMLDFALGVDNTEA